MEVHMILHFILEGYRIICLNKINSLALWSGFPSYFKVSSRSVEFLLVEVQFFPALSTELYSKLKFHAQFLRSHQSRISSKFLMNIQNGVFTNSQEQYMIFNGVENDHRTVHGREFSTLRKAGAFHLVSFHCRWDDRMPDRICCPCNIIHLKIKIKMYVMLSLEYVNLQECPPYPSWPGGYGFSPYEISIHPFPKSDKSKISFFYILFFKVQKKYQLVILLRLCIVQGLRFCGLSYWRGVNFPLLLLKKWYPQFDK